MGGLDVVRCLKELSGMADGKLEATEESGFKGIVGYYIGRWSAGKVHDVPLCDAGLGGKSALVLSVGLG